MVAPKWDIDTRNFERILRKLINRSGDFSPVFYTIGKNFRQSRKSIFALTSKGGYQDLNPQYKQRKEDLFGDAYPILRATGKMERSIVDENDPDNISIVTKRSFAFGSKDPILKYHNSLKGPRLKMPLRRVIFWGPEAPKTMPLDSQKFYNRAKRSIEEYLKAARRG